MARGFSSTLGVSTTDKVASAAFTTPSAMSIAGWYLRNGLGGLNTGRLLNKEGVADAEFVWRTSNTGAAMRFTRQWTGNGIWEINNSEAVASGKWIHYVLVYAGSATTDDPVIYINGRLASGSFSSKTAPTGSIVSGSGSLDIGNSAASNREWDGLAGDQALWSGVLLTQAEARALYQGASPLDIRPQYLMEVISLRSGVPVSLIRTQPITTGTKLRGDRLASNENSRFPFTSVPAGGISGTASITEADDTVSATSTVLIAGVAAITEADDAASGAAGVLISGTLAVTEGDDTLASTSTLAIAAVLAATEADDSLAATGTLAIVGTLSATEADDTLAATGVGSSLNTGALSATEADDTVAAAATLSIVGVAAISDADDAASGAAGLIIAGAVSITEDDDTTAATGALALKGLLSANDNDDTLVGIITLSTEAVSRLTGLRPTSGASRLRTNLSTGARPAAVSRG